MPRPRFTWFRRQKPKEEAVVLHCQRRCEPRSAALTPTVQRSAPACGGIERLLRYLASVTMVTALLLNQRTALGLSPLYEYAVIAREGMHTSHGEYIAGIRPEVSVNEHGWVAFIATMETGSNLFAGLAPYDPVNISMSKDERQFGFPQINNQDVIVSRELLSGNSAVRIWRVKNPGDFTLLASSTLSAFSQLTLPTIGNTPFANSQPLVGFLGREGDLPFAYYANDTGYRDMQDKVSGLSGTVLTTFRSMAAASEKRTFVAQYSTHDDNGRVVVFSDTENLGLWEDTLVATTVSGVWREVGTTPGIADSGKVVAFVADHSANGPGIYLAVAAGPFAGGFTVSPVIQTTDVIAYNAAGDPITLASFDFANRVGVLHYELGKPGLEDDSIVLAFVATPSQASRPNPALPAKPLLFSDKQGIWTMRIDIEKELESPFSLRIHPTTPVAVAQLGDTIDGGTVEAMTLYDPLATPLTDADGLPRMPHFGDHYVAFTALTDAGAKVVRAAMLDTDGDGLMDHWETRGIDMDLDGQADLELHHMGADPLHKDLFLEIDWLTDRTRGGYEPWSNQPAPYVTDRLAQMFAEAPVLNPDGTTGITMHIDAGPGQDAVGRPFSVNMPEDEFLLDGGNLVGMPGAPHEHIDVVYFGRPNSINISGLVARDFGSIKDEYFGTHDKRARELAFKYAVLADSHSLKRNQNPLGDPFTGRVASATTTEITATSSFSSGTEDEMSGDIVKIISGNGAGQVRSILYSLGTCLRVEQAFDDVPDATSSFVVIKGSSGRAEVLFLPAPDNHSRPANDFLMTLGGFGVNEEGYLGNAMIQWRTLAHELGHTFGLRHGGTDHEARKGMAYQSIMSYSFQLEVHSGVNSYSNASDATFDDWAYIKYDFPNSGYFLGNTFGQSPGASDENYPDPTVKDYEELNNAPVDLKPPAVSISSPAPGTTIAYGGSFTVTAAASDNVEVDAVRMYFDLNGDGLTSGPGEVKNATTSGGGTYSAVFTNALGPFGARKILVLAIDTSENVGAAVLAVLAGQGPGSGATLHESSGTIPAQSASPAGQRQKVQAPPIQIPGSGNLTFTVSSTPPVRKTTQDLQRHDASVVNIRFKEKDITLSPVCNPPGSNPAVCTSYWRAPSAGALSVEILGPAVFDASGKFLGHPSQNYALKITFEAVDFTPPEVTITSPAAGGFVGITETLVVQVKATDDYAVQSVTVSFDINGDGGEDDAGETVAAQPFGGGDYRATFANVAGNAGARTIRVVAADSAGHIARQTGFVEVRIPDTQPPTVSIKSPPAGWPIEQKSALTVKVNAYDDVELSSVAVSFDINGDGTTTGDGESVLAAKAGVNLYTAEFGNITGPNGPRTVNVVATDTSMNTSQANVPVTVGGVEPVTETIFTDSGHIAAQPSMWSGGRQQIITYDPIDIPGSGTLTFIVTATPPVRQEVQNIPRQDPYVRHINFNGKDYTLSPSCNAYGADPSICTTTFEATEGGTLDFDLLGPGTWNIWGEFSGHHAQDYTIEIKFTSVDITRPEVTFISPAMGANLDLGVPLTVKVSVVDSVEVASVVVSFDVDGDGHTDGFNEQLAAVHTAGNNYEATFANLSGAPGTRTIEVLATDTSFNKTEKSRTVGVDGVGGGETILSVSSGTIPAQRSVWNGGRRQVIQFGPIAIPGMGRIRFVVTATPNVRQEVQNLQRHDPTVVKINFGGQDISLTPTCNPPGSNPAVCVSVWDSPGAGQLGFEVLGPATYNSWGEFDGHPEQEYSVEVLFIPGPTVVEVVPGTGSVAGHETVTVRGAGFGFNAVVLFGEVAARDVARLSSEELACTTPPGIRGSTTVTVLNSDPEGQPWNYGVPYGLFGQLENGFTYEAAPLPPPLAAEELLGTFKGYFPAVGSGEAQQQASFDFNIPDAGRLRFEAWAFVPILSPIPGPFDDPDNLEWHNESTAVRGFMGGDGAYHWAEVECSDLSYPYGPVICNSTRVVDGRAAGSGRFTVKGPARWNAFWRQFGEYEMEGAPAQNWSIAVWFAEPPSLASVFPASGSEAGGTTVTLTGANFAEGIRVRFGGVLATDVALSSENTLTCKSPPSSLGTVSVEVELLGMAARLNNAFTYQPDEQRKAITGLTVGAQGKPTIGVRTKIGKTYQLQRNDDLGNPGGWVEVGGQVAGNGAEQFFADSALPPYWRRAFYRFIIRSSQP